MFHLPFSSHTTMSTLQLPSELNKTLMYHHFFYKFVGLNFFIDDSNDSIYKSKGKLIFCVSMFCVTMTCQLCFLFTQNEFLELTYGMCCGMILLQGYTRLVIICVIIGVGLPFVLTVLGIIYGAPDETKYNMPLKLYYPVEINSIFRYLFFYIFVITTSSAMHLCGFASYTLLMLTLTYNVCALLRLLHFDLENFIQPRAPNELGTGRVAEEEEAFKTIIQTHQKLLRIASKLNTIFGPTIFVPMFVSSFILCLFGFLVAVTTGIPALQNSLGVLIILPGILNIVWPGQLLIDMSSGVADAAYRSLWYESDVKIRKYILLIINRSQTPCYLSALGFANMTHSVMFKILNTTWTFISVINQVYQRY